MTNWGELSELRAKWLALEGDDAVEVNGWLVGASVAMERKRSANPAHIDALIAELRASNPPDGEAVIGEEWETECPKRTDKIHCTCWYDGGACCGCGDPATITGRSRGAHPLWGGPDES